VNSLLPRTSFATAGISAAVQELRRAVDGGFQTDFSYAFLAAAEAILGNDADAKSALAEALRLHPQLTVKWFKSIRIPEVREGLRKAGLPEG
jgi:adenylate cyclase